MVGNQGYYNDNYGYDNSNANYINLDIPDKSENKPNSPKKKKVWKILLEGIESIVAIMFLIFIADKINDEGSRTTVIQTYGNNSSRVQQQETDNDNVINSIGDSVVTGDVKFTLTELYKTGVIRGENYNKGASEGNIFLVLGFEVENVGYDTKFVSIGFFEASLDGYMIDSAWVSNLESFSGDISPNSKRKGYVVYEVPENWNNLEMHYDSSWVGVDFYCSFAYNDIGY